MFGLLAVVDAFFIAFGGASLVVVGVMLCCFALRVYLVYYLFKVWS